MHTPERSYGKHDYNDLYCIKEGATLKTILLKVRHMSRLKFFYLGSTNSIFETTGVFKRVCGLPFTIGNQSRRFASPIRWSNGYMGVGSWRCPWCGLWALTQYYYKSGRPEVGARCSMISDHEIMAPDVIGFLSSNFMGNALAGGVGLPLKLA